MNLDFISANDGEDLKVSPNQMSKAANILGIQLGSLEYAPLVGIDLAYFLQDDLQFQNASFKSYLVQVLAQNGINVSRVTEQVNALYNTLTIAVGDKGGGKEGFIL